MVINTIIGIDKKGKNGKMIIHYDNGDKYDGEFLIMLRKEKEFIAIAMETYMKETFSKMSKMVTGFIITKMEKDMKVNLKMTKKTVAVYIIISREKSM